MSRCFITNDIPDSLCSLLDDDVACGADTVSNLQLQLNSISDFCTQTEMTVNLKKTEIILFRNGGPLRNTEKWTLNGVHVKVTSVYKYMGLLFTPTLSWTSAKLKLAAQSRKAINAIKRYQLPFGQFSHTYMFKLFDTMVVPILTYGAEILGHTYSKDIEKVQTDFCRYYLGVNSSVNMCMVLGECERVPLSYIYFTVY